MRNIETNRTIPRQQEKDNHVIPEEGYNYYNNNARARAREVTADELPGDEAMEQIAEAYRANINRMITKAAAAIIEQALKAGMAPATVIMAIEETGMASSPSPYYLNAVLRNWAERGVVVCRARDPFIGTTKARPWWK